MHTALRRLALDGGQNVLEYVLTVGIVVVAMVTSFMAFDVVVEQVMGLACPGVDTANGLSAAGACITSIGG